MSFARAGAWVALVLLVGFAGMTLFLAGFGLTLRPIDTGELLENLGMSGASAYLAYRVLRFLRQSTQS